MKIRPFKSTGRLIFTSAIRYFVRMLEIPNGSLFRLRTYYFVIQAVDRTRRVLKTHLGTRMY